MKNGGFVGKSDNFGDGAEETFRPTAQVAIPAVIIWRMLAAALLAWLGGVPVLVIAEAWLFSRGGTSPEYVLWMVLFILMIPRVQMLTHH